MERTLLKGRKQGWHAAQEPEGGQEVGHYAVALHEDVAVELPLVHQQLQKTTVKLS